MATKTTKTAPASTAKKTTKKVEAPMIVKPQPKPAAPVAAKPAAPVAAKPQPRPQPTLATHDQIARRAYEIYANRGYTHGNHEQDWLQAEHELNKR
jgi:hypothetical protein